MLKLYDGKEAEINSVSIKESKPVITYNFEVEDSHTYYVTQSDVLCHNACHGNSLNSPKKTELYALVDNNTGSIKKIGETSRGLKRYSKAFYSKHNVTMKVIDSGTKRSMHYQQNRLLRKFYEVYGRLPELNKGFW